jgi:hypothetical protein
MDKDTKFYKNQGIRSLRLNLVVLTIVSIYVTSLPPSIVVKLKLLGVMVIVSLLIYMLVTSLTWDIYLNEKKIVFKNKYSILIRKSYEFNIKDIEKLDFHVSSKGGSSLVIHSNGKKQSFQTVGQDNAREIATYLSKCKVPTTEIINAFKKINY